MKIVKVNRRDFIKIAGVGSAGLVLAAQWPCGAADLGGDSPAGLPAPHLTSLGTFVEIATNGDVTIYVPQTEMGQGVRTALPMIEARSSAPPPGSLRCWHCRRAANPMTFGMTGLRKARSW